MLNPVADHWYAVTPLDPQILWIREIHVDPYVAGDIWLVRGVECDLVVAAGRAGGLLRKPRAPGGTAGSARLSGPLRAL